MTLPGFEGAKSDGSSPIVVGNAADSGPSTPRKPGPYGPSADPTVTLSHDLIEKGLEEARSAWIRSGDQNALRRALLKLLHRLEGDE